MGRAPRVCSQFNYNVALRIVKKRAEAHLDQKTFAKRLKISQAQCSRLESGKTTITIDHLFDIGKVLGIPPHALIIDCED